VTRLGRLLATIRALRPDLTVDFRLSTWSLGVTFGERQDDEQDEDDRGDEAGRSSTRGEPSAVH
jgi:hypothetical protein